ncbi:MAG: acyltransferase domain-containing protein [Actinoplanes sp.]
MRAGASIDTGLPVVYLLPGQGAQHVRMAAGLYGRHEQFSAAMDMVFALLGPDGPAVRADWLTTTPRVPVDHVTRSQILLFAVDYALGSQLREWGVRPVALLGHSVGEIAAAVLAGVFELRDAVHLMWDRIGRLAKARPGGMAAVAAQPEQVSPFLRGDVVVGAVNAPRQTVVSGPPAALDAVVDDLRSAGFTVRPVAASTAFHSPMLSEVAEQAVPVIARMPARVPEPLLVSGYTAAPLTAAEVGDPRFWASHPVAPVQFWPALNTLLREVPACTLVEVGPGQGLSMAARRHPAVVAGRCRVRPCLPARPAGDLADRECFERLSAALAQPARR